MHVGSSIKVLKPFLKSLFLDLHITRVNLPGLLLLAKKVVITGISQGFFLLAMVYTASWYLNYRNAWTSL